MWNSDNQTSHNLDPVFSESILIHEKNKRSKTLTTESNNIKLFPNKKTSEQNGHGLNCHPHKTAIAVKNTVLDTDNLIKSSNSTPMLEQCSSNDSIYAVVFPDQYTRRQDALADNPRPRDKPRPPPPPPPRRNPTTNLTVGKWSKSQEVLSVKQKNLPQVMNHKTQMNTFTNSPLLHHTMVAQQMRASIESLNRTQSPLLMSKSKELLYQEPNPYLSASREIINWGPSNHFVPVSSEVLNQGPSPYYTSSSREAFNWGQYSPYYMSRSREALNQEENPYMSISSEALNLGPSPNYLSASREPKNLGQSPSMSASCEVLNLEKFPHMSVSREATNQEPRRLYVSASKEELNQELGPHRKLSSREAVNEEPKSYYISVNRETRNEGTKDTNCKLASREAQNWTRNVQNLNTPTRSPSESSSVTLYQPLNTTQRQANTEVAYRVAPYDDPVVSCTDKNLNTPGLAQKMKVPASSHPSSSLVSAVSFGSKALLNRAPIQPKIPVTSLSKPSIPPVPSKLPSPVSAASKHREKRKSLTTTTTVYFRDNPQHPNHTQSMDHLDGPHNSSPTAGQISSLSPPSISSAKSLGSLTESSSSLRSYNQPTII